MDIKKLSITKILFFLSVIIALCFAMQVLGNKLILPFPAEVKLDIPTCSSITNSGEMLVTDSANTRLIFCNKNGKVCHVENLNNASPISKVFQIAKDDNYFYVRGIKYEQNTSFIQSEKVIRYDFNGKNPLLIFEKTSERLQRYPYLYDISIYDNRLYYVIAAPVEGKLGYNVSVFSVDTDSKTKDAPQSVFQSSVANAYTSHYLPQEKKLYTDDYFGHLYLEDEKSVRQINLKGNAARVFLPEIDNSLIYSDPTNWNLYLNQTIIAKNVGASFLSASKNYIVYDNEFDGTLMCYNRQTGKTEILKSIEFSGLFFFFTLLKFLSAIYILFLLLVLIVKQLINLYRNKKFMVLQKIGIVTLGMCIVVFVSWFYTNSIYQMQINEVKKDVLVLSRFFSDTAEPNNFLENAKLITRIQRQAKRADINILAEEFLRGKLLRGEKYYRSYITAAESKESYPYISVYSRMNDRYLLLYDSTYDEQFGESFDFNSATVSVMGNIEKATVSSIQGTETLHSIMPVNDTNGEIVGLIEVGEDFGVFKKRMVANILKLTMELLTIFVAIYLVITEGRLFLSGLRERTRRLLEKNPAAELATMRSLNFLFCLVMSFDHVILVLITREMLASGGYPTDTVTWLMALPAAAFGIGSPIGTLLYSFFARHIPIKKLTLGSVALMALCHVFMIPAIMKNLFIVFVALKFFCGVANSISYSMISSMPYRTANEDDRYHALKDKAMGGVSSSILGAMIGGFVSQEFGNIPLYVVNAVAFIPLIALMLVIIPKNCLYINRISSKNGSSSLKNFGRFLISLPMLSYFIFLTIPLVTVEGYKSYLFPIYSTAMNMPKLYITNFFVFASVIMLLINGPISKATKHINHWNLSIFGMLAMGIAFLGFALNSTIVWAVIMLLINAVLDKIVASSRAMLWPHQAKTFGLNLMEVSSYMSIFERLIFSLKEIILSVFLLFGNDGACTTVGIFCIVFILLFALTTYRSALAKNENVGRIK